MWTLDVRAGQTVQITVDTLRPETAFDPLFEVHRDDACLWVTADDSFDCTAAPTAHQCAAWQTVAEVDGTWTLDVRNRDSCVDAEGIRQSAEAKLGDQHRKQQGNRDRTGSAVV